MIVLETERLILRELTTDDAEFILKLLNEPSFLRFIGDKNVRTLDDARRYIVNGPIESYERNGFGIYLVELKTDGTPIGMSGLVKRASLPDPDVGFAFPPAHWSKGYAVESASAVVKYARERLGLNRLLAITSPDNDASIKVLEKIGLKYERTMRLSDNESEVKLFASEKPSE